MGEVTFTPTIIENCQVSIDGTTYGAAIDSAKHSISYTTHEWKGVSGQADTVVGKLRHKLELTLGQDFKDASLVATLVERHGETAAIIVSPAGAGEGQATITGTVRLAAVTELGGKADDIGATGTTLAFLGSPVITWADATP